MNEELLKKIREALQSIGEKVENIGPQDLLDMYQDTVLPYREGSGLEGLNKFFSPNNREANGAINTEQYTLLDAIAKDPKYGEAVSDSLQSFGGKVGFLESDNIADRVQNDGGGGPGRGKYQYEMNVFLPQGAALTGGRSGNNIHTNFGTGIVKEGSPQHKALIEKQNNKNYNPQGGAETAVRRLINSYENYGMEIPEDINNLLNLSKIDEPSYNIDFSMLPEQLQDELFYADKQQNPNFKLAELGSGKLSMKDAWLNYHWSGAEAERESKSNYYDKKIIDYNNSMFPPLKSTDSIMNNNMSTLENMSKKRNY